MKHASFVAINTSHGFSYPIQRTNHTALVSTTKYQQDWTNRVVRRARIVQDAEAAPAVLAPLFPLRNASFAYTATIETFSLKMRISELSSLLVLAALAYPACLSHQLHMPSLPWISSFTKQRSTQRPKCTLRLSRGLPVPPPPGSIDSIACMCVYVVCSIS